MNLPWVSRLAYENVVEERNRLRERNDELQDTLVRMARREKKMPEEPRQEKKRERRVQIPQEVQAEIDAWDSPATRQLLQARARQLYEEKRDWMVVRDQLAREANE